MDLSEIFSFQPGRKRDKCEFADELFLCQHPDKWDPDEEFLCQRTECPWEERVNDLDFWRNAEGVMKDPNNPI